MGVGMRAARFLLALAGCVGNGAVASRLFQFRFPPNHVSNLEQQGFDLTRPVRLEGVVVSTPYRSAYGLQFDVQAKGLEAGGEPHDVTGRVRLRLLSGENGEARAAAHARPLD